VPGYLRSFLVLGIGLSTIGPALPHLRAQAGVSIGVAGVIIAFQGVGYVVASLVAGRRLDHHGTGHRALVQAGAVVVLAMAAVPFATSLWALTGVFLTIGACCGLIDVACNTLLVWHEPPTRIGTSLNALHLRFGLGAVPAPLLVAVSLEVRDDLLLVALVLALLVASIARRVLPVATPTARPHAERTTRPSGPGVRRLLLVAGAFFALYVGAEGTFGAWSTTYGEELALGFEVAPAVLTAVYWGGFTLGRLAAVALTSTRSVDRILVVSCAAATAAAVALLVADAWGAPTWLAVATLGFALGPQYATMLAVVDRRIGLDGRSTSLLVAAAGTGGLLLPLATGWILGAAGVTTLPAVVAVGAAGAWALAAAVTRRPVAPAPPR
jgi:fucose permease